MALKMPLHLIANLDNNVSNRWPTEPPMIVPEFEMVSNIGSRSSMSLVYLGRSSGNLLDQIRIAVQYDVMASTLIQER